MRIVVLGGTGHIGTHLVPRLVEAGHEVINVSRNQRRPYQLRAEWDRVAFVEIDRTAAEAEGAFGECVAELEPEVVVDLICFRLESAQQLVESLQTAGQLRHFLHCGTIWVHGHSTVVPATEELLRRPFGEYGQQKAAIEDYLLYEARVNGFPATVLHPGHIVGPGWVPVNPQGNFNPEIFTRLARGQEITLPNLGLETLHHVHADDIAQAFQQAINHWSASIGESYHIVSPAALTLRGYAEIVSRWFGHAPKIKFLAWKQWKETVSEQDQAATWDHLAHSPNASIAKAQRQLAYQPRYTSAQATHEAVRWLIEQGIVQT
ncbi:MAG: NAD-dependent epimerase/dehydratase family protein [Chloroflexota bacterium]